MAWADVKVAADVFKATIEGNAPGATVTLVEREPAISATIEHPNGAKYGGMWREKWGISSYGPVALELSQQSPTPALERAIKRATKAAKSAVRVK